MADTPKKNQAKSKLKTIDLEYGKLPPQAVELEEAVLGAVMLEKDAILSIIDIIGSDCFYKEIHQKIFKVIIDLSMEQKPIDILTVTEALKAKGELEEIGGPYYITQLTQRVASAANIEFHARIIAQKFIQRELIRVSSEIQKKAFDEGTDVDDLLEFSESELFGIGESHIKRETQKINVLLKEAVHQIEESSKKEANLSGIPSSYTKLDRLTSGWQRSDLVILAARPSMGKTAFLLSMARNIAVEHKHSVAIFSLEMSSLQLVNRMIVSETELASDKIRNGNLENFEWEQLDYRIKNLLEASIFIDDTPALSIFEFRAKARRLKKKNDVDLIIIDYLQLMTGQQDNNKGNREQEVSVISRSLKAVAKELNVPIIALSQLNRAVELRGGTKRPQLSDLRESGAIEQDADLVLFIHRPEQNGIDVDEEGNSVLGLAEIILAKHRNGPLGRVYLRFKKELAKFSELDESPMDDLPDNNNAMTVGSKMNEEGEKEGGNVDEFDLGDTSAPF